MTKISIPTLRFSEFNDEWQSEKAKNIFINESIKNHGESQVLASTQDNGIVFRKDLDKDIKFNKSTLDNYKYVSPGNVVISLRSFQGGFEISDKEGIISPAYTIMSFKRFGNNTDYWKQYLKTYKFIQSLKKVTFGIRDGRSISYKEFSTLKLNFTENKNEQEKIGSFFEKIDKIIELQIKNLEQLKKLKQGYLQKMFPQDGESEPRLRFSGFSGEWKKEKMGNIAKIYRGASPRPIKDKKWFDDNSKVGWIRISDVTRQHGRITKLSQHLSKEGQKKTRVLKKSHLLLSIAASVGKPVINYVETGVHDGFLIFDDPEFNIDYMYYFLEYYQNRWNKFGQPGSQVNLNSEIVKSLSLYIPSVDEQKKIASFIKTIDKMINNQSKKVETLKQQKKAYLQKMFI